MICISSGSYKYFMTQKSYNIKLVAFLTLAIRISMFFPLLSNSPKVNLQNRSCKVIELFTTDQGFKILARVRIETQTKAISFLCTQLREFVQKLLITNNKKGEAAPKNEADGTRNICFFLLGLIHHSVFILYFAFYTRYYR